MKSNCLVVVGFFLFILGLPLPAAAAEGPVYVPPDVEGTPDRLVGAGTRAKTEKLPRLEVLAPRLPGWTGSAQPALYWYVSREMEGPVNLSIVEVEGLFKGQPPLLESTLKKVSAGVHCLDLNAHGVVLEPGVEYDWRVDFKWPPRTPQKAGSVQQHMVVSRATLIYKQAPPELRTQVAEANPENLPALYAQAGYWYDSVAALGALIEQNPGNSVYLGWRANLLKQEELLLEIAPQS